jgi:hypothetical protein
MTITIARRELERPLHPEARKALGLLLMHFERLDLDDTIQVLDDVDTADWVMLPNGRRELRDMADDVGLFAFLTIDTDF